jgi:hypothetical protein
MQRSVSFMMAMVLAITVTMQPVLAGPPRATVADQPVKPAPATPATEAARTAIAHQLAELGRSPGESAAAASRLTIEDLDVLLAHPEMMQAAGSDPTMMYVYAAIIIIAIIAAVASSNGSVMISL